MATDIILPEGRIVAGHPMKRETVTDDRTKQPKVDKSGQVLMVTYVGIAIPKTPGVDWKQTPWGMQIVAEGNASATPGVTARKDFAWKITDGDSKEPNKNNTVPSSKEGYPGHWVLNCSTYFDDGIKCYHNGKYDPMQQIQNAGEIKRGDYGRLFISVKPNNDTTSPGVYLNPVMFSLDRIGELIEGEGPKAADVFGGGQAPAPAAAPVTTPPPPPAPAAEPHTAFVDGPKSRLLNGVPYTEAQLEAAQYSRAQIEALPLAQ